LKPKAYPVVLRPNPFIWVSQNNWREIKTLHFLAHWKHSLQKKISKK